MGTEEIDAFTVNWADENNWWGPPIYLVCRLLYHAKICHCSGTLVVPAWKSSPFLAYHAKICHCSATLVVPAWKFSPFWPILCPEGHGFAPFVQGVVVLPECETLIIPGKLGAMLPVGNP